MITTEEAIGLGALIAVTVVLAVFALAVLALGAWARSFFARFRVLHAERRNERIDLAESQVRGLPGGLRLLLGSDGFLYGSRGERMGVPGFEECLVGDGPGAFCSVVCPDDATEARER